MLQQRPLHGQSKGREMSYHYYYHYYYIFLIPAKGVMMLIPAKGLAHLQAAHLGHDVVQEHQVRQHLQAQAV